MSNHYHFDDELLSAYVDGELTADERALVEERLRNDPQAAQLVEELRSLSSAVKSLPRETLGRDLRASIFSEIDHADAGDARHVIPLSEPLDPPRGFRRGFIWSTIAIAAALMIMFLEGQEPGHDRDVAAVAKKDADRAASDRKNGRRAPEDDELPNLGEMHSLDAARPAAPAAAEPGAGAGGGLARDSESLPPANEPAAPERQLAQSAGEPAPMGDFAESGEAQADALAAQAPAARTATAAPAATPAAAPAPAAMPIGELQPVTTTVELAVKADNGLARFKRHLAENNFALPAPVDEAAEELNRSFGIEAESAAEGLADNYRYALGGEFKSEAEPPAVEVLVEGSPEQIESLLAACAADNATFADVNGPQPLERNEFFSRDAAPTGGALGGAASGAAARPLDAAGAAGRAEDRQRTATSSSEASGPKAEVDKQTEPTGRAWILSNGLVAGGGLEDAQKAKESLDESRLQLETADGGKLNVDRRGGDETPAETQSLAKRLSEPPEEGRVRVRFVLRAAQPQPAAAAPAAAEQ
jgi:hypothetical protein